MLSPFDQKKQLILREILGTSAAAPDASPKGTIDVLCISLIDTINSHPDMVTTSLCSGRVSVFLEGNKTKTQIGAKGHEGRWLFVTHDPESLLAWHESIDFAYEPMASPGLGENGEATRYILFKFEPLILHVKCRDSASANLLYSTAMACGFRESGIGSNHIVGIRILIKLDIPIGFLHGERLVLLVSSEYLGIITQLSLDRFKENFRKMDQLEAAIKQMRPVEIKAEETKEERRLRKIEEGMKRRESVRAEKEKKNRQKLEAEGGVSV
ncbi:hypothetical protein METBIDRAFT_76967 [Metschnikowia bicuspidata var. bicuspidata NRRL YB-4993]|uniref:tRNA wybutosine-synthesizing protein 3 n=1 Tax=Metschnikowia bicuspidata var. bicuspidata NRRL YB-4993 TaxID=869754 RepID=A0A1A0HJA3_9ASCO|nr:hypothetical protein METBIDRAFT_76967 [Metschnikowia bicuspidata var. bicuspidata NRRL YB-4993]OBA24095.1 hypothetical protein METBIDRAFT_76967 [Metschnikowia bicuspidata var. bicuspidata NRRL YB-4993]